MQVHLYYNGGKANAPAMRKITEVSLMEEFHWLPHEIARIPYKKIQEILIIKNQKNSSSQTKLELSKIKNQNSSMGRGQSRRFTREV